MTRKNFSHFWWTYFLLTQTVCVTIGIDSTSRRYQDPDDKFIDMERLAFDRDDSETIVKSRRNENSLLMDSHLETSTRRSRRSKGNKTLDENRTMELDEEIDFKTGHKPNDRNLTATGEKPIGLKPVDKEGKPTFPGDSGFEPFIPEAHLMCGSTPESCANRCSNQSRLVFSNLSIVPLCGCDTACNDIFMDCCSDYTKRCGDNVKMEGDTVYLARKYFHCETELELLTSPCDGPAGVWMISRCPNEWYDDVIRGKCHAPPTKLDNRSYDALVPVFSGVNQLTYRNQYCALCHNVTQYHFWRMVFRENAVPPAHFNRKNLMKFIAENGQFFKGIKPRDKQPLRYCYFPTVIKTCPDKIAPGPDPPQLARAQCLNGSVEIVHSDDTVYKNRGCSSCHGVKSPCLIHRANPGSCFVLPKSIARFVDLRNYGVSLVTTVCPRHQVYDPYLGACRRSCRPFSRNSSRDSYAVVMSILKYSSTALTVNSSLQRDRLRDGIAENFNLTTSQVTNPRFLEESSKSSIMVSFTLHLTPFQTLILSSDLQDLKSPETVGLQKLFRFEEVFNIMLFGGTEYTVYRVTVRRLACIHARVYRSDEYVVLDDQRIYVNSTGVIYEQSEYDLNTTTSRPHAIVCLKLAPLQCNGSYIYLNSSEYHLLPNLTLVYESSKHDFGDYTYKNGTVSICVSFERKHQISTTVKPKIRFGLMIVNFIGFNLSVVCLFALMVTYSIFKQLRTLPGKNLMSLALSLAIAELLWMCGSTSAFTENRALCTGIAIAVHYFFLVYFTASSVIAYDSCTIFGRSISLRRSQEEERKRFLVYFLVIWTSPALFVLTFSLLDHYGSFAVDYGVSDICWLGTGQSMLLLFVLPLGALVLFNLSLFVLIAVRLYKNRKSNSQVLASALLRKRDKQNVLICVKLSTLMGFSWLFLLLHVVVKSETDAFLYLFVIFVSLQGVFVCVAFLFNRKCFELYRDLLSTKFASCSNSSQNNARKGNNCTQETKL